MELSSKKLKINLRTPQTFYQELIIPFVIVLLFVAIGKADFIITMPGLDMTPESYNTTSVLYYNSDYSNDCAFPQGSAKALEQCTTYILPEEMVTDSIMCNQPGCEASKLYTKS